MNFSEALELLKQDKILTRTGWNGSGLYIKMKYDHNSCNKKYVAFFKDGKFITPWTVSQSDLIADDWVVLD